LITGKHAFFGDFRGENRSKIGDKRSGFLEHSNIIKKYNNK